MEKAKYADSQIPFFDIENVERYAQYGANHPDMAADEVVWRVNNHLDKEKYGFDVLVEDCHSLYVLVNKYFKLPDDFCPKDLVDVDGILMRSDAALAFTQMRDKAKAEGFSINAVNAYRSLEEQQNMYDYFCSTQSPELADASCARPGYSEHHTGLAIDIEGSIPGGRNIHKTPEAAWVRKNCYQYGFIVRYLPETVEITGSMAEPWHLRYVGKEVSRDMREKNINTFEEYRERFLKSSK